MNWYNNTYFSEIWMMSSQILHEMGLRFPTFTMIDHLFS